MSAQDRRPAEATINALRDQARFWSDRAQIAQTNGDYLGYKVARSFASDLNAQAETLESRAAALKEVVPDTFGVSIKTSRSEGAGT